MKTRKIYLTIIICLLSVITKGQWTILDTLSSTPQIMKSHNNAIYLGTSVDGIFQSNDYGENWNSINGNGLTDLRIRSIEFNEDNIYVGTMGGGIFYSTDNGSNWQELNNGLSDLEVLDIKVYDDFIFAATYGGGIYRSNNNGQNWTYISDSLPDNYFSYLLTTNNGIYAGSKYGGGGIYFTEDYGETWIERNNGVPMNPWNPEKYADISSFCKNNNAIFVSIWGRGIIMSQDLGESWETLDVVNYYIWKIANYDTIIFAGHNGTGFSISIDNGQNWKFDNEGIEIKDLYSILFFDDYIFAGSKQGHIYRKSIFEYITDIKIQNNDFNCMIYPNPNIGDFWIPINNTNCKNILINVYDIVGNIVLSNSYRNYNQKINLQINEKGFFIIETIYNNKRNIQKIIIK